MKRLLWSFSLVLLVRLCSGQQSITLTAPGPPAVTTTTAQSSEPGLGYYCWWVTAIYPIGTAYPTVPTCLSNAGGTVTVRWAPVDGATAYDVLRTSTPTLPSGFVANLAVAYAVPCCSQADGLGPRLSPYTVAAATSPATATLMLNNRDQASPQVNLDKTFQVPATILGPKTIGAGANQLPSAASCSGCITIVTDAASGSDCTVGSGSTVSLCRSTGSVWASIGGGGGGAPTFSACHAYTYTSGTLTVDLSSFPCSVITASGANPTLAFTAPSGATPLTIGLCNDATARTWTLPATAKQFSVPFTLSTCAWNNGVVFDGANYEGPGTSDTPSILGLSAERAAPSVYPAGGALYPNSTDHLLHSLNAAGDFAFTRTVASGQTAMPTGALGGNACSASATTATATGGATTDALSVSYASDPTGVTGYGAGTSGGITVRSWVTANTVNFKLCNESSGSITPGALNINWRLTR